MNKQVLYAGLFGLDPFAGRVITPIARNPELNPRTQRNLKDYLSETVGFLREISLTNPGDNHQDIYKGYTQFLFVFEQISSLEEDLKFELITGLNEAWIDLIETTHREALDGSENVDHSLSERFSDFTAFLVFFHQDEPEKLVELIEPYAELYSDLADEYQDTESDAERDLKEFYKQLKLAGAWVNRFHDPESLTPELWSVLEENFYEIPETRSRVPRPLMARYGYPTGSRSFSRDGWWLRPDNLWSYTGFQDTIAEELNGEEGENYVEFHERLAEASQS